MLMAMFFGCIEDTADADIGGNNQSLPLQNDLLQFKAGSHIMGFKPDKVYLVNMSGFLSVEFLGASHILLKTAANASQLKEDITSPQGGNTLANLHRVEYAGLWDGITLRYDATTDGIAESSYIVQAGADVSDVQLRYNGATELQQDGSLKIQLPAGQGYITESRPVAWQILDGQKMPVQVAYEIKDGTIGFKTGTYSKEHELIIDPTYQWHTFHGSANYEIGYGIAVDTSGNVYITGRSNDTWGNPVNGFTGNNTSDIVVVKLDSAGVYQWHTFHGSTGGDEGRDIAVDGSGNIYVTGWSLYTWGGPLNAHSGWHDIVILKLNSSGTLVWHTFQGSAGDDEGLGIAVDDTSGNSYVTGFSSGTWGSPLNAYSNNSSSNIVVLKLDSLGIRVWNTFYGSPYAENFYNVDRGNDIAVDGTENVYITGFSNATWGSPLNPHNGDGYEDIVVLKLNSFGARVWNTFHGAPVTNDEGYSIAVDSRGNVYVTGVSSATWGNPVNAHSVGDNYDIVVLRLNSAGTRMWNTFHGVTDEDDWGYGIAVDSNGSVFVTGSGQANWGNPLNPHSFGINPDIVFLKLNDSSGTLAWHTFYGSTSYDSGFGVAVDGSGNFYGTGYAEATWGSPIDGYNGDRDIVALKFSEPFNTKFPWPMFLPSLTKEK
jgi:hypothetical protein